jgi:HPt (histidine-containing phosphotransfer) domain-containing protein
MARRDLTGAVDFSYLEGYAGLDQNLVDEVLSLFREQAGLWLRLLEPTAEDQAWRDAAHTLKGAALGVGAHALAQACAEAELAVEADIAERTLRLDRVRNAMGAALADIAAYAHEQALKSLKSPSAER